MRSSHAWACCHVAVFTFCCIVSAAEMPLLPGMNAGVPLTDAEFFSAINLDLAGMAKVKNQVAAKNWSGARSELYTYMRDKFRRANYYSPPTIIGNKVQRDDDWLHSDMIQWWIEAGGNLHGRKDPLEALATMADQVAAKGKIVFHSTGRAYQYDPGKPFDYLDFDPRGREYHEDIQLYSMYDLILLRDQYFRTGKRIYLNRSTEMFASYCKWYLGGATSQMAIAEKSRYEHPWEIWTLPRRLWAYLRFFSLLQKTDLPPDLVIDVMKAVLEDERLHVSRGPTWVGNFRQYMCMDGAMIAAVFFEFKQAKPWFDDQVKRLESGSADLMPDGSTADLSTSYSEGYILWLSTLSNLLKTFQNPLTMTISPEAASRYEKAIDWQLAMRKPGGRGDAQFNDNGETQSSAFYGRLAGSVFRYFGREDLRWFATEGRQGRPPVQASFPPTSTAPSYGGLLSMRSDWTDQARYLVVDFGPLGGHSHPDYGSFLLHAYGAGLIDEGGCAAYGSEPYLKYSRSPYAHNIVAIDGESQPPDRPALGRPLSNWITNDAFDYAWGQSDLKGIIHHRAIFFAKPDYFLVLDAIDGKGSHRIRSKLQLWWDVSAAISGNTVQAHSAAGPSLQIVPLDQRVAPRIVTGQKEPFWEGWLTRLPHSSEVVPAPAVVFEEDRQLPVAYETLLYPAPAEKKVTFKTERVLADGGETQGALLSVEPSDRSYSDEFIVAHGFATTSFAGRHIRAQAKLIHLRYQGDAIRRIAFVGASHLAILIKGLPTTIDFDKPTDGYLQLSPAGTIRGARVYLDLSNPRKITHMTVRVSDAVFASRNIETGRPTVIE